jgi:signal transduction histidine kinase
MMLIAFTSIYLITYNDVRRNIEMELHKVSQFNRKPNESPKDAPPGFNNSDPLRDFTNKEPPQERSISFTLIIDNNNNKLNSFSVFDMDEEFLERAKKSALSKGSDTGSFKLDETYWTYIKMPAAEGYRLVFLDITSQQDILTNLIYTFLVVALIMLIVIYFISIFFANRSIHPIKEAFDKQKQFIADASHELKTPLAVINTNVDVLLSNNEDSIKNQSKWLYYIKSEVERMSTLTNSLLYLTQINYSDKKMIFTNFNLSEAIENVILTMEAVIFENNIFLNYDIEPNLIIHGNIEQIKQVAIILLDNALKYTNSKGKVDVSLKRLHNNVILTVTNTGEGIPEEHINKIFDRFYRIDKSRARKSGGYGLGLSIAKAIIDEHNGRIFADSILNVRTTFTVELPLIN